MAQDDHALATAVRFGRRIVEVDQLWVRAKQCLASRLFVAVLIVASVALAAFRLYGIRNAHSDSWGPMMAAADFVSRSNWGADIYQTVFFLKGVKFQYPPVSLLYLHLAALPGLNKDVWLNFINWIFLLLNAAFLSKLADLLVSRAVPPQYHSILRVGIFLCALMYAPIAIGFRIGQIQVLINLLFTAACLALVQNRSSLAGVLIGLTTAFKPQFAVLALFGAAKKRSRFLLSLAAVAGLLGATSLVLYGWSSHVSYVRALGFLSERGEAYYWNNSINGIVNRYLDNGSPTAIHNYAGIDQSPLPPYNPIVHILTVASALLFLCLPLAFYPMGREPNVQLLFFSIVSVCSLLASPVAWIHHYGILPPLYLIALHSMLDSLKQLYVRTGALLLSFLVTSVQYPFFRAAKGIFTIVHAPTFFATCILLGVLIAELMRHRRAEQHPGGLE